MKAIILAAGIGSRLRPITNIKPKGMVKVNGQPIIEYQIKAYLSAGICESNIYVVAGYKIEMIENYILDMFPEINIIRNNDYEKTNNMFSLYLCLRHIANSDVVISNGDCVYADNIVNNFILMKGGNLIASDRGSYTDENMKIIVKDGVVTHISKQIAVSEAYGNSIDLYKIECDAVEKLLEIIRTIIAKDRTLWTELALDELFEFIDFLPYDIQGKKWMEIDNFEDLQLAETKFCELDLDSKKAIIFDLDGTVYLGNKPIVGTIDFIKRNVDKDIFFITNNTSKDLDDYIVKLESYGLSVGEHQIISPLLPLVSYLNSNCITNVYIVGNECFQAYLRNHVEGLSITDNIKECQAVIVAYDTELTYEKLKKSSLLLHDESKIFLATHEDIVCPTEDGNIPDIGSMLKLLELTTHRRPDVFFGKPNDLILEPVLNNYSTDDIVIVGDRVYTDMVLAKNNGIDFVLVLSGETKRETVEALDVFPEMIVPDLGAA